MNNKNNEESNCNKSQIKSLQVFPAIHFKSISIENQFKIEPKRNVNNSTKFLSKKLNPRKIIKHYFGTEDRSLPDINKANDKNVLKINK